MSSAWPSSKPLPDQRERDGMSPAGTLAAEDSSQTSGETSVTRVGRTSAARDGLLSSESRSSRPDETLEMRMQIGEYKITGVLGQGGMGLVYRASNVVDGRPVALKVCTGIDSDDVRRFGLEADLQSRVNDPGVVRVYGSGEDDGRLYHAMELVPGRTLDHFLRGERGLPIGSAVYTAIEIAQALQAVCKAGLVHRDVKPSNLIVDLKGRVKLGDFGLARLRARDDQFMDGSVTRVGDTLGTPLYMPPEQASISIANRPDIRSDVYSLCATLFHLLTGRPPFKGGPIEVINAHCHRNPPSPREFRSEIPAGLASAVLKGLRKEYRERPYPDQLISLLLPYTSFTGVAQSPRIKSNEAYSSLITVGRELADRFVADGVEEFYNRAKHTLDIAVWLDQRNPEAYFYLGELERCYGMILEAEDVPEAIGRYERAVEQYDRGLRYNEENKVLESAKDLVLGRIAKLQGG